jgi:hypothetical protein
VVVVAVVTHQSYDIKTLGLQAAAMVNRAGKIVTANLNTVSSALDVYINNTVNPTYESLLLRTC